MLKVNTCRDYLLIKELIPFSFLIKSKESNKSPMAVYDL